MKFLETDHPFFKPLWIRVLIVAFCVAWGVFEFIGNAPFWGVLFLGMGVIAFWGFFIDFDPDGLKKKAAEEAKKEQGS